MRHIYRLIFAFVFCCAEFSAAQPYTCVMTADNVVVRSGPGNDFYPVLQLQTGDKVEVYYEQGEWCAIRPPIGSFSWVSARFVQLDTGNIGTVLADGLASRIGSDYSDDCDTVQVTLKKGEHLFILERREMPDNLVSPVWFKIAPPSGEFRWVHKSVSEVAAPIRQVRHDVPEIPEPTKIVQPEQPIPVPKLASVQPYPAIYNNTLRTPAMEPFQKAFSELQREAYVVMTRPTDDDVFVVLIQRAEELYQIAPTDIDLEKTYHLLESLKRTRIVRRELAVRRPAGFAANPNYPPLAPNPSATSGQTAPGTSASPQSIISAYTPTSAQSGVLRSGTNVGGYDIVGRLGEFDPLPQGHPPYAVVDEKGQIICMISPSSNLDLSPYIGQFVGINGVLGEWQRPGKPNARHITARNVRTLR